MLGLRTTKSTLMNVKSYTRQPIDTEKRWSLGIQQPHLILKTLHNIDQNNIDFYYIRNDHILYFIRTLILLEITLAKLLIACHCNCDCPSGYIRRIVLYLYLVLLYLSKTADWQSKARI